MFGVFVCGCDYEVSGAGSQGKRSNTYGALDDLIQFTADDYRRLEDIGTELARAEM